MVLERLEKLSRKQKKRKAANKYLLSGNTNKAPDKTGAFLCSIFTIILPHTPYKAANIVLQRDYRFPLPLPLTASIRPKEVLKQVQDDVPFIITLYQYFPQQGLSIIDDKKAGLIPAFSYHFFI